MEEFTNPILIIFILLMLFCMIRGARKGMLRLIYGVISWVLLLIFVNMACDYISDYLNVNTSIPTMVQEQISTRLNEKYEASEETKQGSGMDGVMELVPKPIKEGFDETIHKSVEATIQLISTELSETAVKGIAFIISVAVGVLLLFILDKLIVFIGELPGIDTVNSLLGIITGFAEGLMLTWLFMYLADCFPTTIYGQFIISNTTSNSFMDYVYQINIIEQIIEI
ncbi:Colicin V production protein [Pseudobutyrivibrio sp. YE44]|uniref:CvpA family protein n=1 Tax=Pseudobutyrivibrio sp. YE44 TaxID=1520802 RepID=UPI00087E29D9|nr:CvpA family protein [Pseudobutyrivibrio sp. YE44]SDB52953.1 Colicin V production protein [Pseudobutyrivibrio sp. YE44]